MTVDWSQSGETMENLVAVLLRRENPRATQIRPSQGDGGIDIRSPLPAGGVEIFQVKKFNSTLTAGQVAKVKKSFKSLNEFRLEHGIDVRAWHLVMPLNPTNTDIEWFEELTKNSGFECNWRGRDYLEGLAAKFPDVVDYYLTGGAERLERVVGQMVELLGMDPKTGGSGLVTPAQVAKQLEALRPLLDTDPHFRYGISLDPTAPNRLHMGSDFVAAYAWSTEGEDGSSAGAVAVKIYPRFDEALDFRPIPGSIKFRVEPGSKEERDLEQFLKYGAPLETPLGTVDFDIDLPGGLGGSFEGGAARIGAPLGVNKPETRQLRLAAVDPQGTAVAQVLIDLERASVGIGGTGFRTAGTDHSQVFDIEVLGDIAESSFNFKLTQRDLTGRSPSEVLEAVRFVAALRPPQELVIAQPYGPIEGQRIDLEGASEWVDLSAVQRLLLVLETLDAIQQHTSTQIVLPPPTSIDASAVEHWIGARQLLEDGVVEGQNLRVRACLSPDADFAAPFGVSMETELSVRIGEQVIELGRLIVHASAVEAIDGTFSEHGDHQDCDLRTAQGAEVTIRRVQSDPASDDPE